ncbi:hypothetical protein [Celeribacter sp. PS-C1]|uniref:hypothetical protein n=1 Tax=Celeribacter sp. PS-C1 TaxID=2820813 RepID=UPI001CA488CB|nr:hypothetical protein [Celeribacter sp. PS-C1]MBW6417444.1 hypothetical protein [Celeribacter sp. PS-C1]
MAPVSAVYFELKFGKTNSWVATLGPTPEIVYDKITGKEDFTELRKVKTYCSAWKPGEDWTPQPICIHERDSGRKLTRADRIMGSVVGPFLSENAVEKMRPLLEREGYVLPLAVKNHDENFYLWWVPWVEDSIDFERSEKHGGGLTIKKPAINYYKVEGLTAFRRHYDGMYNPDGQENVIVNDEFRRNWLDEGLTGILFEPV